MATGALQVRARRPDRIFFPAISTLILAIVFVGFAKSYFLAGVFRAPLPNVLVHVHGAVFSCWILLLIAQTSLVASGRTDLHRRLGLFGFGIACLMVVLGVAAATDSFLRHAAPGAAGAGWRTFYAMVLTNMLLFAGLMYVGFRERRNPAAHKRYLLIATIVVLDAAFARWPVPVKWWNLQAAQLCCYSLLLMLAAYDLWSLRRIHRVTLWASTVVIVAMQARLPLGRTALWQNIAVWLQTIFSS